MPIAPGRPVPPSARTARLAAGLALALAATAAPAAEESPEAAPPADAPAGEIRAAAEFDLSIRGIRAGQLLLSSVENAHSYSAAARMSATGLAGLIVSVRYDAQVIGLKRGNARHTPARYEADIDSGRRRTQTLVEYKGGVPEVLAMRSDPPRGPSDTPVDPASQGDALDPLTAIWLALRPLPEAEACAFDMAVFDGQRRSGFRHTGAERTGEGLVCTAELRRVAGFSREDMAERESFALRMVYAPVRPPGEAAGDAAAPGLVQLIEAEVDSRYGTARLRRR